MKPPPAANSTLSGPISGNGNSLVAAGAGKVTSDGPGNNDITSVNVASGELVIQDPAILASGSNLTVGNAALFSSVVAAEAAAPAPTGHLRQPLVSRRARRPPVACIGGNRAD